MLGKMTDPSGSSFSAAASMAVQEALMNGLQAQGLDCDPNVVPPPTLVHGALHVYRVALLELTKQVSGQNANIS